MLTDVHECKMYFNTVRNGKNDMKTQPRFVVPITLALTLVFLTAGVSGIIAAD